jgi:general secretion pathway protein D
MGNARKPFGRVLLLSGGAGLILGLLILGFGSSAGTIAQQRETTSYEPYSVKHLPASELASRLRDTLARLNAEAEVVPDPQNKRVLVKGSGVNQRLVSQLIQTLDRPEVSSPDQRPVSTREAAPTAAPPQARGYTVHEHQLDDVLANLREHFGRLGGVRFAIDQRTKQIIAVAPNELQEKIADKIAELNRALAGSDEPAPATTPAPAISKKENRGAKPKLVAGQQTQERQLKFARAEEVEERLKSFYGRRLGATVSPDGESAVLAVPVRDGEIASLRLDRRTGQIRMDGSAAALTSLDRLLAALDHGPNAPQVDTELLTLDAKEPERVQRALTLLTAALRSDDAAGEVTTIANRVGDVDQATAEEESEKPAAPGVKPAPQPAAPASKPVLPTAKPATADNPAEAAAATPGNDGQGMDDGDDDSGLIGAVQIEYIDGLDILVIRGKKRDVERVTKMIQDIEEISQQTKPIIQVYPLKHTNNQALATLLLQVYDQILSTREGRVTILPLVKPNSILLIGREESVKTIVELIQKLDQPVSPSAMLKVFPLRNMAAADAELTVRNFFTGVRTGGTTTGGAAGGVAPLGVGGGPGLGAAGANAAQGLGSRVVVVADYRSNSLIVQASPRDLTEVAKLIKEIDVEVSPFTAELRVFKLKNTLAQDTANVLTAAIRGQATAGGTGAGGQAGAGQFGQPGGGVGGAAGNAANAASRPESPRSASLQFVTVDGKNKQVLAAGIASDVIVTADVSANSILVRGPSRAMELIAAIIEELDTLPNAESQLKVFTIENGDATAMTQTLQQVFGQPVTAGRANTGGFVGGVGAAAFNFGLQNAAGAGGANAGDNTLVPLRFATDVRSNSVLVSGSKGDLKVVEALVVRLDERDVPKRRISVYKLRNSLSDQVAQAVTNFLTSQRQVLLANQAAGQLIGPFEQLERELIVMSEPLSNSLIISATPQFEKDIERIIRDLDYRPPMVIIEVLLAEVQLDNLYEMGVELGLQDSLLYNRGLAGAAASNPGFNFNNAGGTVNPGLPNVSNSSRNLLGPQGLSNFNMGRVSPNVGYGGLVLSAASDSINILIRALQQSGRLQLLSRPSVMAIHNRQAQVNVGSRVPRVQGSTNTNAGVTQNVTDVDVGLILTIIPQINEDNIVVLNVQVENSKINNNQVLTIPSGDGSVNIPAIDNTRAVTTISARDGQTVVFAGLIQTSKAYQNRRVPYLSDIPAIGKLFEYKTDAQQRRELLIVMTPKIVKTDEDYDWVKTVESERMSWCLGDVVNIHGDVGLRGGNCVNCPDKLPVIYPDRDPTGMGYSTYESPSTGMQSTLEPIPAGESRMIPSNPPVPNDPYAPTPANQLPNPQTGEIRQQSYLQPVSPTSATKSSGGIRDASPLKTSNPAAAKTPASNLPSVRTTKNAPSGATNSTSSPPTSAAPRPLPGGTGPARQVPAPTSRASGSRSLDG